MSSASVLSKEPFREVAQEETPAVPDEVARAFSFGSEAFRPMSALPALDRLSERMARRVRDVIGPFARFKPRVANQPVAIRRFESWIADQPEFTSLNTYRVRPLKGGVLIAIEPQFVTRLVDTFYGGSGTTAVARAYEFTATEEQLAVRLADAVIGALTDVWSEVIAVQSQITSRETNTSYASLVRREDPVAIASFSITLASGDATRIDILYPVAALRAVESELSAKIIDDGGVARGEWRDRLGSALSQVRIQTRSVLGRPNMQISELLKLAPGDFIPMSMPKTVPLIVAGKVFAHGTIGEQDGRTAIKIVKINS
jgi:flagellar motor switch protein FliM